MVEEILSPLFVRHIPDDLVYKSRIQEEYALIERNNFTKVFLQVRTILRLTNDIPHIIRGSAGSSLICYLLGITEIDPIKYQIELARFMNTARQDLPDIDMDFPYNRRDEVYQRIQEAYPGLMARISNHILFRQKTATRRALREAGYPQPPRDFILNKIVRNAQDLAQIQARTKELLGQKRTTSLHCGGIVIFEDEGKIPDELLYKAATNIAPAQLSLNKDETEDAGYIKIDILANRGLAQLAELHQVLAPRMRDFLGSRASDSPTLLSYPARSLPAERILSQKSGNNIGITFAESRGMRKILAEMEPQSVTEIAIALALIRPAAAADGRKRDFLELWRARLSLTDPLRRPILFDDDALAVIRETMGCSAAEADQWRKSFAKQNPARRLEFRLALQAKGYDRDFIDSVIDDLSQLALYSFCKSHALSYAQLVWALAFWKAHAPHEFWIAALNHCHSEYRPWVHRREAIAAGLRLPRAAPPYRLGKRAGQPAAIPMKSQEQAVLLPDTDPRQIVVDMKRYGVWFGSDFLPGCGLSDRQMTLDGAIRVKFRGLIATGRVSTQKSLNQLAPKAQPVTLVTIGVGNSHFIDITMKGDKRDCLKYAAVTGVGLYRRSGPGGVIETINAESLHGVGLNVLIS